ncbi:hypothetical protein [Epibacterium ulvae]|uniref:hypothetical protein n=1 Tax=Epibacterium ulvae TaxID=1156985 RepID=UPI000B7FD86A|nr:hypothetical protein [Epibacterium ulvae]
MTTLMLLLARRDGSEEIPFAQMAREYFGLEPEALDQKSRKERSNLTSLTIKRNQCEEAM